MISGGEVEQGASYPALPFTTRIVVRRPSNPRRSNGTVVLEWMNVSLQQDTDVDWIESSREILNAGFTRIVKLSPRGAALAVPACLLFTLWMTRVVLAAVLRG